MEKVTEFLKKNWIWVLIAVVVIIYLLTRKKKTESNFSVKPSVRLGLGGRTSQIPVTKGWFDVANGNGFVYYPTQEHASAKKMFNVKPGCVNPMGQWQQCILSCPGTWYDCAKIPVGSKVKGTIRPDGQFEVEEVIAYGNSFIIPAISWSKFGVTSNRPWLIGGKDMLIPRYQTVPGVGREIQ